MLSFSSVQFSHSVMSDSLQPHEPQHARPPCPSPTPRVHPNPCPSSRWCHPTISSSVVPFSSCPQSLPESESFPMSQLLAWGGQSIGVSASASVFPMNTQDWSPLGWTGWISLQSIIVIAPELKDYSLDFLGSCWDWRPITVWHYKLPLCQSGLWNLMSNNSILFIFLSWMLVFSAVFVRAS